MIPFRGTYFDGKSSRACPVVVSLNGTRFLIVPENEDPFSVPVRDCTITPPLGKTIRLIKLPAGAQIETGDLKAVAELEAEIGSNSGMRLVHYLESRWKTVAATLVGLALFVWVFITFGIPLLAKEIASSIPPEITETVSLQTLKVLDAGVMKPSELSEDRIGELRRVFNRLHDNPAGYRLEFRKSPDLGPNALALPSGIIVVTDELVKLARDNRELEGVLLHEMAHVEKRHGLRTVIQNAGAFVLISALVGDITSISSAAGSLPIILTQSGYSREFEREADEGAALYFIKKGWRTRPFQNILLRITKNALDFPGNSLFSSHPVTDERIKNIQELEKSMTSKPRQRK